MSKPPFNSNQPFEVTSDSKPPFDESKPFSIVDSSTKTDFVTSPVEAAARSFADTATFGLSPKINAGVEGLIRGGRQVVGLEPTDKGFLDAIKNGYSSKLAAENYANEAARKDQPVASIIGGVAAGIPQLVAPGGAALKLGNMALQGGAQGLGHSNASTISDLAGDVSKEALINGLLGKAGEGITTGLTSGLEKTKIANALKALGAQKAQIKAINPEYRGDVAQYALDKNILSANPFKPLSTQQAEVSSLQNSVGDELSKTRDILPTFNTNELINAITSKNTFNPTLGVNSDLTKQLNTVQEDLRKLTLPNSQEIPARDVLDLKSQLYNLARKSNGEVNPAKDVLENSRQGISAVEQKVADSPAYSQQLKDYAILKKIEQLQNNKANQVGNSFLGLGGLIGGSSALGGLAAGHPGIASAGILGIPSIRNAVGETSAVLIDRLQKLVQAGKLDPKLASYLISKGEKQ